jgi:hypothetical protein
MQSIKKKYPKLTPKMRLFFQKVKSLVVSLTGVGLKFGLLFFVLLYLIEIIKP